MRMRRERHSEETFGRATSVYESARISDMESACQAALRSLMRGDQPGGLCSSSCTPWGELSHQDPCQASSQPPVPSGGCLLMVPQLSPRGCQEHELQPLLSAELLSSVRSCMLCGVVSLASSVGINTQKGAEGVNNNLGLGLGRPTWHQVTLNLA